jgi:hypothetical protein
VAQHPPRGSAVANTVTVGPRRRLATNLTVTGLFGIAAIHALWASGGGTRPARSQDELADLVVGLRPFPSSPATWAVAALIAIGAGLVVSASHRTEFGRHSGAARGVGPSMTDRCVLVVLAIRGVVGFVSSVFNVGESTDVYRRWDLLLYSPLCIALAVGVYFARRATPKPKHRDPHATSLSVGHR